MEAFPELINVVDSNIQFTREDVRGDSLPLLGCAVHTEEDMSLNIELYRKPTLSSPTGAHAGGHQNPKPSSTTHKWP